MTSEWEEKHVEWKNDEIRLSTDAMTALVVTEAEERQRAKMPSLGEMNAAFQPANQFQKKMEKLLRTAKSKRRRSLQMLLTSLEQSGYIIYFEGGLYEKSV